MILSERQTGESRDFYRNFDLDNKRLLTIGACLALVASMFAPPAQANSVLADNGNCDLVALGSAGTGTSSAPFEISTAPQLWELADCSQSLSGGIFSLRGDISLTPTEVQSLNFPIGARTADVKFFSGQLLGNGFGVRGFNISSSTSPSGLFSMLDGSKISNLRLEGSVRGTDLGTGGLAGKSLGALGLNSVSSNVSVSGKNAVGGVIGAVDSYHEQLRRSRSSLVTIYSVTNFGTVTPTEVGATGFGGLVGSSGIKVDISNSANYGEVSAQGFVGGLAGVLRDGGSVLSSKNFGKVSALEGFVGGNTAGGLVAESPDNRYPLIIQDSENHGTVQASSGAGGLVAQASTLVIRKSKNFGEVTRLSRFGGTFGGLVGYSDPSSTIESSSNHGGVSGGDRTGGLQGTADSLVISDSFNTGAIKGFSAVGGLVGETLSRLDMERVYNIGDVSGFRLVGGLIGKSGNYEKSSSTESIRVAYNLGAIESQDDLGGLVGGKVSTGTMTLEQVFANSKYSSSGEVDGVMPSYLGAIKSNHLFTTAPSSFSTLVTELDLTRKSTFTGFNFSEHWAFTNCSESRFPIIRLINQTSGSVAMSDSASCTAKSFLAVFSSDSSAGSVTLNFQDGGLGLISEPEQRPERSGYKFLGWRLADSTELIKFPFKPPVYKDLNFVASWEKLPETVTPPQTPTESPAPVIRNVWIPKGSVGSSSLSRAQKFAVEKLLRQNPNSTKLVCTGVRSEGWSSARALAARKSAKAVCDYAKSLAPRLSIWVQSKPSKSPTYLGRVLASLSG